MGNGQWAYSWLWSGGSSEGRRRGADWMHDSAWDMAAENSSGSLWSLLSVQGVEERWRGIG